MNDEKPNGIKQFQVWAHGTTLEYLGFKPAWTKADYICLKNAYDVAGSESARRAWTAYLRCDEAFPSGKSPRLFWGSLDRWRAAACRPADSDARSTGPAPAAMLELRASKKAARDEARESARRARTGGTRAAILGYLDKSSGRTG